MTHTKMTMQRKENKRNEYNLMRTQTSQSCEKGNKDFGKLKEMAHENKTLKK